MHIIDEHTIYSISDLIGDLACDHLTVLEQRTAIGLATPPESGADTALMQRKADEHEQRYLSRLREQHGGDVVEFATHRHNKRSLESLRQADAETFAAMAQGAAIIAQPTFFDGIFLGRADILRRIDTPSAKWAWSYEVLDLKLALQVKVHVPLQLSHYAEHITRLQGSSPDYGYVLLGSGVEERFRLQEYAAYYRYRRKIFLQRITERRDTYPIECAHCAVCRWSTQCDAQREADDHLSLVANIRHDHIGRLRQSGITTLSQLAETSEDTRLPGLRHGMFLQLRAQARLQQKQRTAPPTITHPYYYELLEPSNGVGFATLPEPDIGDLFFDIEGDPMYTPERGLEYLWGFYLGHEHAYRAFWAYNETEERATFERVIDFLCERLRQYPRMHIYHYAPYEISALRRLSSQYATREHELDSLLQSHIFVDLYAVVRQSVRISQSSYSIKKLEPFYGMLRKTDVRRGDDSIVQFETWLLNRDDTILADIEQYNNDDCRSTYLLRQWLIERKEEAERQYQQPIPWSLPPENTVTSEAPVHGDLSQRLISDLKEPRTEALFRTMNEKERARWLLGHLLEYHRRDAKPAWWKFYDRQANIDRLLDEDHESIGGLVYRADIPRYKKNEKDRNEVHTFAYPEQQHTFSVGDKPFCPEINGHVGEIVSIDHDTNMLHIKLSKAISASNITSLIPDKPLATTAQKNALVRLAEEYLAQGADRPSATHDLLLARIPRLKNHEPGASIQPERVTTEAIMHVIEALDDSYLVIQGPPGTGKTTKAASIIVDLLAKGQRIGILASKHKTIHNLLHKIEEVAERRKVRFRGLKKSQKEALYHSTLATPMVINIHDTKNIDSSHDLIAGTQWLFSSAQFIDGYDYLFIDEAGQISLADALACSPAAKKVVLLGDPLQLAHVSQGTHPTATGLSILEHLLDGHATIPPHRGIFLNISYRLSPQICSFLSEIVYERRLSTEGNTDKNSVTSTRLNGSGLRQMPIDHRYNTRSSPEEASAIVNEIKTLLDGYVVVNDQSPRRITPHDILVVTPYNAQRALILKRLSDSGIDDVQVGTVDKFQGLEAPVVFYSLAASSGESIPRDRDFLFEINRLNVAISRAQCLAVLVYSPRLLDVDCTKPKQTSLINALCAFIEHAEEAVNHQYHDSQG